MSKKTTIQKIENEDIDESKNDENMPFNQLSTIENFYQINNKTNVIFNDNTMVFKKTTSGNLQSFKTGNNAITEFLELKLRTPSIITYIDKDSFLNKIYPEIIKITKDIDTEVFINMTNILFSNKKNILLINSEEFKKYQFTFELNEFMNFINNDQDIIGFSNITTMGNIELLMRLNIKISENDNIDIYIYDDLYEKTQRQQQQLSMGEPEEKETEKEKNKDFNFTIHISIIINNYLNKKKEILPLIKKNILQLFENLNFNYPIANLEKELCIDSMAKYFLSENTIKPFLVNYHKFDYTNTNEIFNFVKKSIEKDGNIIDEILETVNKIKDYNQFNNQDDKKTQLLIYKKNPEKSIAEKFIISKSEKNNL